MTENTPLLAAPPKYSLEPAHLEGAAGSSPTLAFTVTSDPPLAEATEHTLSHKGGGEVTKRFKVESSRITFRKVRVEDSGTYTISCCSDDGEVGQATLELEVTPLQHQPADSHGTMQTGKGLLCLSTNTYVPPLLSQVQESKVVMSPF